MTSLQTMDISMSEIDQLLEDDNGNSSIPLLHKPQHKIQDASTLNSGDPIPLHVSVGFYDNDGHRQQRRNSLDSTMSALSFDETFGPITVSNYKTPPHNKAEAIRFDHSICTHIKRKSLDSEISRLRKYPAFGPRCNNAYDGRRHIKTNSIPYTATVANSFYQKHGFRRRRSIHGSEGMAIASISDNVSSLGTTGSNTYDTACQDITRNVYKEPHAKPHLCSSEEYTKEMMRLTGLMKTSQITRRSVRYIKMDSCYQKHQFQCHQRRSTLDSGGMAIASVPDNLSSLGATDSETDDTTAHQDKTYASARNMDEGESHATRPHFYCYEEYKKEMMHLTSLMNASEITRRSVHDVKMKMHRDFLMYSLQTPATAGHLDRHPRDPTDTEDWSKHENRRSDFGRHFRHKKHTKAVKSRTRKFKERPLTPSTI